MQSNKIPSTLILNANHNPLTTRLISDSIDPEKARIMYFHLNNKVGDFNDDKKMDPDSYKSKEKLSDKLYIVDQLCVAGMAQMKRTAEQKIPNLQIIFWMDKNFAFSTLDIYVIEYVANQLLAHKKQFNIPCEIVIAFVGAGGHVSPFNAEQLPKDYKFCLEVNDEKRELVNKEYESKLIANSTLGYTVVTGTPAYFRQYMKTLKRARSEPMLASPQNADTSNNAMSDPGPVGTHVMVNTKLSNHPTKTHARSESNDDEGPKKKKQKTDSSQAQVMETQEDKLDKVDEQVKKPPSPSKN